MSAKRRKKRNGVGAWLKRARVVVSLAMLAVCCVLFTTLTAEVALSLDWAARLQLVPLTLAGCTSALAAWVALTLVFGRLYCSWFCPMGAMQDIFARLRRLTRKQAFRHRYSYSRPKNLLRYIWLGIIVGGHRGRCAAVALRPLQRFRPHYVAACQTIVGRFMG